MVANPPDGMPRITPYMYYNDVAAAVDWLQRTFGLQKRFAMPDESGGLMHAELETAEGVVMLGPADKARGGVSPADLKGVSQGLYVYVEDVQGHYDRAKEAGATITMELEDMFWGDRVYAALDLEGHQWSFAQHVKDVPPEEMTPP